MPVEVYKVVKADGWGALESAVIGDYEPELRTVYYIGEIVKAPVGRLFAFDTHENAQLFMSGRPNCRVYRARCGTAFPITTKLPVVARSCAERIRLFWKGLFKDAILNGEAPKGTVSCDYIQLIGPA